MSSRGWRSRGLSLILARVKALWVAAWMLLPLASQAVEVRKVEINYQRFHRSARLLEIPGFQGKEAINLGLNFRLVGPLYWDNEVKSLTDDGSYRYIAWSFGLRVRIFPSLSLAYHHESGHLLDHPESAYQTTGGRFPVRDSLSLDWTILEERAPEKSLF